MKHDYYKIAYIYAIFFIAQIIYYYLGMNYGSHFFGSLNQVGTDPSAFPIAKEHFWQTLWYYHLLPPGYMIYAYGFPKLFPPDGQLGFYILHTIFGLWAVGSLYKIQERLGINKYIALSLITLFILSPAFNLFQSLGWYDWPSMCLLVISTWRVICFADVPNFKNGFIFFLIIALLCSIRSMYHVSLYFVPVILVSLIVFRKHWKLVLLSAALPFIIILAMYFKNYLLYGIFSVNSYYGENLSMITMQWNFPLEWRYEGIEKGYFSDLALCPQSADTIPMKPDNFAFTGIYCWQKFAQKYRDAYIKKLGKDYKNVPLLQPIPNVSFIHRAELGNIGLSQEYAKNAMNALLHYPQIYFKNIRETWRLYFCDSVSYFYENMGNVKNLPKWFPYQSSTGHYFSLMIMFPFLFFFGVCWFFYKDAAIIVASTAYFFIAYAFLIFYHGFYLDRYTQLKLILLNLLLMLSSTVCALFYRVWMHMKTKRDDLIYSNIIKFNFDNTQKIALLFILCDIIYSTLIMTMVAGNEQQRYRFYLNGLYLILFGLFIQVVGGYLFRRSK